MADLDLGALAPEVPPALLEKLVEAPEWTDVNAYVNEKDVFERQYAGIAQFYYAQAASVGGKIVLEIFQEYKPLVELFVRHCLKSETVPGEPLNALLVGEIATGNSQAFLRPITYRSFTNCAYEHIPTSTGKYDLIPNTSGTESATTKKKAWAILGWIEPYAKEVIPYDEIQVNISDSEGKRRPLYPRVQFMAQGADNIKVIKENSPKLVEPGNTLDVDVMVRTANVKFGLWPLGIELIRADDSSANGPSD